MFVNAAQERHYEVIKAKEDGVNADLYFIQLATLRPLLARQKLQMKNQGSCCLHRVLRGLLKAGTLFKYCLYPCSGDQRLINYTISFS